MTRSLVLSFAAALTLAATAGTANAFHPFEQPRGYQMPKRLQDKITPRNSNPSPPAQQQGWNWGGSSAPSSIWGSDDDDYGSGTAIPKAQRFPAQMSGGARPHISPIPPPVVSFPNSYGKGTIVIDTAGKSLYYVLSSSSAYKYPISVGRIGFTWTGTQRISRVASWPDWRPPEEMKQRQPGLPNVMTGGVRNPLGARALYLGNTLYRIHGTNDAKTIGQAASSGCFRMLNGHVVHLAGIAGTGTTVKVLSKLPSKIAMAAKGGRS